MKNIIVIYGGRSTEHEVAIRSAVAVINNLDRRQYRVYGIYINKAGHFIPLGEINEKVADSKDLIAKNNKSRLESISDFCLFLDQIDQPIVFPVIHGQTGEDGEIQGFLETLDVTYIGTRLMGSALCMDKGYANQVLEASGLPTAPYFILTRTDYEEMSEQELTQKIESVCGFPCFVKPCNNGSSVGVNRADKKSLVAALEEAFNYDRRVVVEKEVVGVELELSILGNRNAKASLPGSYTASGLLDYDAKYNDSSTKENVPHPLADDLVKEVQELALRAYQALSCEGLARVDIFMDENKHFFINEINTFPGMTQISLAPKLWVALTDMTYSDYLDEIIEYALESEAERAAIKTDWEAR